MDTRIVMQPPDGLGEGPPLRRRRREARPAEIIAAALSLFVERGFAQTRLDDVAGRAGVSKGTVYLYFATKEELFKAVVRSAILTPIEGGEAVLAGFSGPSTEMLHFLVREWRQLNHGPAGGILKLMVAEAGNFPAITSFYMEEVVLRGRRLVEQIVARGVARGEFRRVDVEAAARVVLAPLTMRSIYQYSLGSADPEPVSDDRFFAAYLDLLLAGIQADPESLP